MDHKRIQQCCKRNRLNDNCLPLCSYAVAAADVYAKAGVVPSHHCKFAQYHGANRSYCNAQILAILLLGPKNDYACSRSTGTGR
uniref:Uncharacterized protein n=1 Tax=Romanomermis culicivorax TaxID=13658 RepID=A0A915HV15_ROMCU